jgi:hypothetical protein
MGQAMPPADLGATFLLAAFAVAVLVAAGALLLRNREVAA